MVHSSLYCRRLSSLHGSKAANLLLWLCNVNEILFLPISASG